MKIYLVGGVIRDRLLGRPGKDKDWVVIGSTPKQMQAQNFRPVGKDFPVFLHPQTKEQYALARTEKKTGRGHTGFTFDASEKVTLEQDLARRDLTINAIAETETGDLIDPFNGQQDIKAGILRHVTPAFVEDPLRVLRVARFAARLGFRVAPATLALMKEISGSGELESISPERIWNEVKQAMGEPYPSRFILVMRSCQALSVLFPEIDRLFGVPQPKKHHPEVDTGVHTLMSLNQATHLDDDARVRFAVLLHDLGKGTTNAAELPHHHGHEERGAKLIEAFCRRYRVPNEYRELAVQVARYHTVCHRVREMRASTILKKLESMDAFRKVKRFERFLVCCEADSRGRAGFENRAYPQADCWRDILRVASGINIDKFKQQEPKLDGPLMANAVRKERLTAIRRVLVDQAEL